MSDEKDDGGNAFPSGPMGDSMTFEDGRTTHQFHAQSGMTLRDWFAGQVLAGLFADANLSMPCEYIASLAYKQANAMIEARKK